MRRIAACLYNAVKSACFCYVQAQRAAQEGVASWDDPQARRGQPQPNFLEENRRLHPTRLFFPGQTYDPEV